MPAHACSYYAQRIALLRPLLIFFVIAVHLPGSRYRPDTQPGTPGLESLGNVLLSGTLGMVAVPMLSVMAGYLAYHSYHRHRYASFIRRKVRHLLLPMLLWNLLLWHELVTQRYLALYQQHYLLVWGLLVLAIYASLYGVWWLHQRLNHRWKTPNAPLTR